MRRYASEVMANPESLAEHSYAVVMIGVQILHYLETNYGISVDFRRLMSMLIFHDVPEILIGDIPTPLKTDNVKKENSALETLALDIFKNKFHLWVGDVEKYDSQNRNDIESRIVKSADYISAIVYCTEEIFVGSVNFEKVLFRALRGFVNWAYNDWENDLVRQIIKHVDETLDWDTAKLLITT